MRKAFAGGIAALSIALSASSGGGESQAEPPTPEVTVATPLVRDVLDWDDKTRAQIRSLPFDEEKFRKDVGATALTGERGWSVLERLWMAGHGSSSGRS